MSPVVVSSQNARVAAARKLQQRKERAAARAFLVEGPRAAAAALDAPGRRVRELFLTPAAADREVELLRTAAHAAVHVTVVADTVLRSLADSITPQGVVAVVALPPAGELGDVMSAARLVAVLVGVADPGNAGTVIRTADAAGADAVVLTDGSVDPYNAKAVRASAGSVLHLPLVTATAVTAVESARAHGLQVLATTLDAADDLDDLADAGALAGPTVWLFGNEAHGLDADLAAAADRRVRIPIHGRAESLNLAAAAAICLYASARAQHRP